MHASGNPGTHGNPASDTGAVPLEGIRQALDTYAIVVVTDSRGAITYANERFCEISRFSREELIGADHRIVNSGHHPREFFTDMWRTISSGQVWRGEIRNRASDGSIFWLDTTIVPVADPGGTPSQYLSIRTDITARKQRDEEFRVLAMDLSRELDARLRAIVDTEPHCVKVVDASGILREMNGAGLAMLEADHPGQVIGQPIITFVDEPDRAAVAALHARVLQGHAGHLRFRIRGLRGAQRWVESRMVPLQPGRGGVSGALGITVDITQERAAQDALRMQAQMLDAIGERVELHNAGWQMLSRCNEAMLRARSERELLQGICRVIHEIGRFSMVQVAYVLDDDGQSFALQAHAGPHQAEMSALRVAWSNSRAREGGPGAEAVRTCAPVIVEDTSTHPLMNPWRDHARALGYGRLICLPLLDGARAFGVLVLYLSQPGPVSEDERLVLRELANNVSFGIVNLRSRHEAGVQLQRMNAELEERVQRRTRQLQAAIEELEAFSYSVSHDLRAPLAAINGFASVVEDTEPLLSDRSRSALARIRAGALRMEALTDGLLALSRLPRSGLAHEQVDLSAMAHEVIAELGSAQPREGVVSSVQDAVAAAGDPRLLRQVLANLLGNAWKFTSRQPQARIEFGGEAGGDGQMVYWVADDGPGFDAKYVERLFRPFERLHKQSEFPGTGIGLATVRRIVQLHGGRIWADTQRSRGARFCFTLGMQDMDGTKSGLASG